MSHDPDAQRFRDCAEGRISDSPVENDWRSACPRCSECNRPIDEDEGCLEADCIAEKQALTLAVEPVQPTNAGSLG